MEWLLGLIKNSIRFILILSIFTFLLSGGYVLFVHEKHSVLNDMKPIIIEKIKEVESFQSVEVGEIKEHWSMLDSYITISTLEIKKSNQDIKINNLKLSFDVLNLIKNKSLKLKAIDADFFDFEVLNSKKTEEINFDIENLLSILNPLNINIKDFNISYPEKNIDLKNVNIIKNKDEEFIYLQLNKKLLIKSNYKLSNDKKTISLYTTIDSNRSQLKKLMQNIGIEDILELIDFEKSYSVIGDLKLNAKIDYEYKTKTLTNYDINIKLNGNKIVLNDLPELTLTNAIGNLYYNKNGFSSDKITANLNKKSSSLEIEQKNKKNITFNFETQANVEKLSKIVKFPLNKIITGSDSFKGYYELNFKENDKLFIESDLKKINYLTKIPLKEKEGFVLEGYFDYKNQNMNFNIKQGTNEIQINFLENKFYNIMLSINKAITKQEKEQGFFVSGFLNNLDLFDFLNDLKEISNQFKEEGETNLNSALTIDVLLKNIKVKEDIYESANFLYQNNAFSLELNESDAVGTLYFNQKTNELEVNVEKFHLKTKKAEDLLSNEIDLTSIQQKLDQTKSSYFRDMKIKLNIKDLQIDNINNKFTIISTGEIENKILTLKEIKIKDAQKTLKINGSYIYDSIKNKSKLIQIDEKMPLIEINDISKLQTILTKANKTVQSESVIISGFLEWNGFELKNAAQSLTGLLNISMDKGYIPRDLQGVGALKALNLFNIDSWFSMLSLNFKDMEEGLYFNSIKGSLKLESGSILLDPRLVMDSDLFILEMNGSLDYINSKYDLKLDTIVPLLNKAPAIALFAGVAPEVVGVIWVVDKLAGDFISEKFTRTTFNVSGDFENPIFKK